MASGISHLLGVLMVATVQMGLPESLYRSWMAGGCMA